MPAASVGAQGNPRLRSTAGAGAPSTFAGAQGGPSRGVGAASVSGGPGGGAPGLVRVKDKSTKPTLERPPVRALKRPLKPYVSTATKACVRKAWSQKLWRKNDPKDRLHIPWKCRTWRCPDCARHVSQVEFARLREALKKHHVSHVLMLVLTLDPKRLPEKHLDDVYKGLQTRWQELERIFKRGSLGAPTCGKFDYATYVEAHANGLPHMNVVVCSKALARFLRNNPPNAADLADPSNPRAPRWFRTLCAVTGWGYRCSIENASSKDNVASYVTKFEKTAMPHPTLAGEVTKLSQLPYWAPQRSRRVRSSKGFLPPRKKESEWTGKVVFHPTPELMLAKQDKALNELLGEKAPAPPVADPVAVTHMQERAEREWEAERTAELIGSVLGWEQTPEVAPMAPPDREAG